LKGKRSSLFTTLVTTWKSVGGRLLLIKIKMNWKFWKWENWKLKIRTPRVRISAIESENWKKNWKKIGKKLEKNWKNWKFWKKMNWNFVWSFECRSC